MSPAEGLCGAIGNTPLIEIPSLSKYTGCRILAKAEFQSPGGSVKDRPSLWMVKEAEAAGKIQPGGTLVEGTGGNTGIGLALIARARGYKCIIVMNNNISDEKKALLRAFGAELVLTEPCPFSNPNHYFHTAQRIANETPGAFFTNQFENLSNSRCVITRLGYVLLFFFVRFFFYLCSPFFFRFFFRFFFYFFLIFGFFVMLFFF
eukprot:Colp12_sorted_trinity150504_noHs@15421